MASTQSTHPSDLQIVFRPIRPDFSIRSIKSTTPYNCYHETLYEVISDRPLDDEDFARLDLCGLLGIGQAYNIESREEFVDVIPPVTIDRRTGLMALDVDNQPVPPTGYNGQPYTATSDRKYHRYTVKRICDSGD